MFTFLDSLIGNIAYRLWDLKEGRTRLSEMRQLIAHATAPKEQQAAQQAQKLQKLLTHAQATSPWYKKIIAESGIDLTKPITLTDLHKLPVTTKLDIRDNTDAFISSNYRKETLVKAKTGGSTGTSLNLFFDHHCQKMRNGAQHFADSFSGWKPGIRIAAIWGNPPVAKTFKQRLRSYLLERMIYLDTMDLNQTSMGDFVSKWRKYHPELIFGHAHSIYIFAKYVLETGNTDLRPKGIVATSMMLLDHERNTIEKAFGCKVSNRYGCEEVGLIAVECEAHQGMHINNAHIVLECLDEHNKPVAEGNSGKLVITDLNNYAMPLIRYRVEDVGGLSSRQCSCGRTTPLLERLEGRVADFLKKPDGGQVAGVSLVERTLTKVAGLEQMQLVQETPNEIIINRVKGKDFTTTTDSELIQELREVFDNSITLTIKDVEKIPQEKSGKYRFSICKI